MAKAHELGIDVWALVTDVDSMDLYGVEIDFVELLSSSANRRYLIDGLMAQVDAYGLTESILILRRFGVIRGRILSSLCGSCR